MAHRRLRLRNATPRITSGAFGKDAFLSVPITDTNAFLTYSSRWVNRGTSQAGWDANALGLGGWSLNLVQRYDLKNKILIAGDGTWRQTSAVQLPSGELAVPSYDGAMAFIFDSAGRHIRTVDGRLGTELVKVMYDSAGRILQVDGSANGQPVHVLMQRDTKGAPKALLGIDGGMTALALDNAGHLIGITNPAGETTRIAWNSAGLVESETDSGGGVQQFTYDSLGLLASATDADGVTQRYDRKVSGDSLEVRILTALGRQWTYRAESVKGGIRRTFIRPDGTEDRQTSDAHGNRILELADGTIWNIGTVANPVWSMASPILTPIVETRPGGISSSREIRYSLESRHGLPYRLTGSVTTTINGHAWTQHFDPDQRLADLLDPTGRRSLLQYDESGRPLSYSAPGMAPVSYTYNGEGRRTSVNIGTGKLARTTRYAHDASTGQITKTRPDNVIETSVVDRAGRLVTASAGDGSTTVVGHDAAGRVNRIQPPAGLNFTLGTSPAGRYTAFAPPMVDGDGSIETSLYDKDGQISAISGLGNRSVSYEYDSAGRVSSATFGQGKRTFSYDPHSGLIKQASDPSGVNTSYRYAGKMPTSLAWSGAVSGSVSVALDANGRWGFERNGLISTVMP
jgi:YD repeat-containing protein